MPQSVPRLFRGPLAAKLLAAFGVDARRYWLLVDLFGELADRRDLFIQIGASGSALKYGALFYLVFSGLLGLLIALAHPSATVCLAICLGITAFLLLVTLLPEAGNSLVNPVEGLVLAHQPVDGATYTAAKLTHLLRILAYLVPSINLVPSLVGWTLPGSLPAYPLVHMAAAYLMGLAVGLGCCALYGWLTLLFPASRLKSAGQWLEMSPWLVMLVLQFNRDWLKKTPLGWAAIDPRLRWPVAAIAAGIALFLMAMGLRALSADYLAKVAGIVQGRSRQSAAPRRRPAAGLVSRWLGGPPALGGFDYASILMRRDSQFRRQVFTVLAPLLVNVAAVFEGARLNPFEGPFSPMHIFPHALGIACLVLASIVTGGSHPRAAWIFLLVQDCNLAPFARGIVLAFAWLIVGLPNLVILALLAWTWSPADALLFVAFSVSVSLAYLAASLHLIEGLPFARQVEPSQGSALLPIMLAAGLVTGVAVALQHYLLFGSRPLVLGSALLAGAAGVIACRYSVKGLEESIRFHLANLSFEASSLYREVN